MKETKDVFTIIDSNDKPIWLKIGVAFVNKDGSINIKLNALPLDGMLQVRDRA
ncbi:MAG: hypothetical protein ACFFG0_12355 [Candidatus Thorarchaeota archaeon]